MYEVLLFYFLCIICIKSSQKIVRFLTLRMVLNKKFNLVYILEKSKFLVFFKQKNKLRKTGILRKFSFLLK